MSNFRLSRGVATSDMDPFSSGALANPAESEDYLRESASVTYLEKYDIYAMARYDEVHRALNDWESFSSENGVGLYDITKPGNGRIKAKLLEMDPPDHTRFRSIHNKVINPSFIRSLREEFRNKAFNVVKPLIGVGAFDAVEELAMRYPLTVFPELLGLDPSGIENLMPAAALTFNGFGPNNDVLEKSKIKGEPAQQWLFNQAKPGATRPGGLADLVHKTGAANGLEEMDTLALVFGLYSAGLDTTVHGIGWALYLLANNPDQFEKLKSDPSLARQAFDEAVRLGSPVKWFGRHTTRDVNIGDAVIPKDSQVVVFLGAANRDPRRWDEPLKYDITRQTSGHVGFGAGVHSCAGQMLARLEGECILTELATSVSKIELTGEPEFDISNSLRGLHHLPISFS